MSNAFFSACARISPSLKASGWPHPAATLAFAGLLVLLPGCAANSPAAGPPVTITSTGANAVTVWDEVATSAINMPAAVTGTPEERMPLTGADHATVHLAIYDAVMAIAGTHRPYAITPTTPAAGASMEAAANAAAYGVMRGLFPARANLYQTTYDTRMAGVPDGDAKTRGTAIGAEAARGMLALRANDGRHTPLAPYAHGTTAGKFRAGAAALRPYIYVKPFALTSAAQFRAGGPPALDSAAYAADFNETKSFGRATNSARNEAQTESARFYTDPPPLYWPRNLRQFGAVQASIADNARLMAQIWVAQTDSLIGCMDSKYHYNFWRPATAITLADSGANPATQPEAGWTPVVPTPPHPEYPAAHSCVTTGVSETLRHYFRTNQVAASFSSGVPNTVVHRFSTTDEMSNDSGVARIYGGMHFRSSLVDGALLGKQVANWIAEKHFGPRN